MPLCHSLSLHFVFRNLGTRASLHFHIEEFFLGGGGNSIDFIKKQIEDGPFLGPRAASLVIGNGMIYNIGSSVEAGSAMYAALVNEGHAWVLILPSW